MPGSADRLAASFAALPPGTTVYLNSRGGSVVDAILLAQVIRQAQLNTSVGALAPGPRVSGPGQGSPTHRSPGFASAPAPTFISAACCDLRVTASMASTASSRRIPTHRSEAARSRC